MRERASPLATDLSDAPDWLCEQHAMLEAAPIPPDAYQKWNAIIASWLALERALKFEKMVRGRPSIYDYS